jgi:hypothetical protein
VPPLAPRPEHWSPAGGAAGCAEYVTLALGSEGRQGDEVEAVLKAVERCKTVSWVAVVAVPKQAERSCCSSK